MLFLCSSLMGREGKVMKGICSLRIILLITVLMIMAGCDTDEQQKEKTTTPAEKKIILSAAGIGPINASTPFNIHQITLAFDDYSVTQYTKFQQGEQTPVIRVSQNGTPLIIINPDTKGDNIFSVIVNSNKIGNALGHELKSTYQDIYNYENREPCMAGTEELSGKVLCIAPKTANIIYQFHGQWDGPDGEIPPTEILSEWVLESIIWKPQR
ncbi:MAG TPA: DUF1131 family protein [Thiothrix sp.]|nr:DUF1131 family protein [Thiothrix sp.]